MRIQETNKIMKESAYNRQPAHDHEEGMIAKTWKMMSHLPTRITGMFRKH
jgi:hypothetical protein